MKVTLKSVKFISVAADVMEKKKWRFFFFML